jgi:hypothetical protein
MYYNDSSGHVFMQNAEYQELKGGPQKARFF